jgi:hypothetical protein
MQRLEPLGVDAEQVLEVDPDWPTLRRARVFEDRNLGLSQPTVEFQDDCVSANTNDNPERH